MIGPIVSPFAFSLYKRINNQAFHVNCISISGNLVLTILHGPLELLMGITYGILFGMILWAIPPRKYVSYLLEICASCCSSLFQISLINFSFVLNLKMCFNFCIWCYSQWYFELWPSNCLQKSLIRKKSHKKMHLPFL